MLPNGAMHSPKRLMSLKFGGRLVMLTASLVVVIPHGSVGDATVPNKSKRKSNFDGESPVGRTIVDGRCLETSLARNIL
jgi:hypothetical protein